MTADSRGAALRVEVLENYDLSPSEFRLLDEACETADLLGRLNGEIRGLESLAVVGSRGQASVHPIVRLRNETAALLSRQLEGLRIPALGEEEGVSPVLVARAKKAAAVRWGKEA